jgi:hypothetical protein
LYESVQLSVFVHFRTNKDLLMPVRYWLRLAEVIFILVLATALFVSLREGRLQHNQLTSALAEAKQTLSAADTRQHDRDAQLERTLATLAALKKQIQTPAQLTKAISLQIPLPIPLAIEPAASSTETEKASGAQTSPSKASPLANLHNLPSAPTPSQVQAVIPNRDLQPLYDFALDCKACQTTLSASQADLADERAKTAALSKERDVAVKAAKGGTLWRRAAQAAKWFALGAAAGALAAKSAR